MTPPKEGGRRVPKGFIPYDGTKKEEIKALKLVFRIDGSNPYKDDAYNINRFKPQSRYEESDYQTYVLTLHSEMEVVNKYVAIQDLMKHMFTTSHMWVPPTGKETTDRYKYSRPLHEYIHRRETPEATRRRTGIETPPRSIRGSEGQEEEYDWSKDKEETGNKDKEETESENWKTIKRIKDREQRVNAREKTKQRLTMTTPTMIPKQTAVKTLFESDDEEEEDTVGSKEQKVEIGTEKDVVTSKETTVDVLEDDVISRLEVQEQEYLLEQEETRSEVLGENSTSSTMEEMMERMMERKMKVRFEQMEENWRQKQTASIDRMMQLERSACEQVTVVQEIILDAESMLTQLNTTLTKVTDRIEESNIAIQEVDNATTVIADFTDAAHTSRIEFTRIAEASKAETIKDAKAMKAGLKKLQQKLTDTKDRLVIEIQSLVPSTTHVDGTRKAIQNECQKVLAALRAEKDRNIVALNDKSRSIREEFQKLTTTTTDEISSITKDAIDTMDITVATVINQSNRAVESVIQAPAFNTTIQKRIDEYIKSYPMEMNDAMQKFTEVYFTDNDTLEHYIKTVARSVTDVGNIQAQIEEQVIKIATEWMRDNINETETPTTSDKTTEDKEEKNKKKDDEYTGGKPSLFEEAEWRKSQEEEARETRESQESAIKRMTQVSKAVQRFESKPMHKHCIPTKNMINMEQARLLYNEMYDDCLTETLPLTEIKDLATNESCIPAKHEETDAIIETISHAIMRRLLCIIPQTNNNMLEILGPFTNERDGYGALYAIMRRTCSFMKPTTQGWGPAWPHTTSPSKYATELQTWVSNYEMRHKLTYTDLQQSQEMLHQALQSYNTPIATKLTGELNHWINANPTIVKADKLPNKWKITGIADKFSDYHKDTTTPSLSINTFDAKKSEGGYAGKGNKRFELRNKKQCACCKMAGHNIGDQVCRIGAQMWHATKYETANKETYQENADKYFKMNRPVHINRVMRAHPEHNAEEDIMEECEKWITKDDEE